MDAKEEILKLTLGKIVTGLLLLAGFLVLVVWREALFGKWVQVTEGVSKQGLLAALGLALLAVLIEALCIAYLGYAVYQRGRALERALERAAQSPGPLKPFRGYGVHWDEDLNPLCPACNVFLPIWDNDGNYEILWCPKCKEQYRLRDDYGERVSLVDAKLELTT